MSSIGSDVKVGKLVVLESIKFEPAAYLEATNVLVKTRFELGENCDIVGLNETFATDAELGEVAQDVSDLSTRVYALEQAENQSAESALGSADAAAVSASQAAESAQDAAESAQDAAASAAEAAASALAAASSETNSALSETNASTSEDNAYNSAAAALVSETNAAASALSAQNNASTLAASVTTASESATSASASATNAQASATSASASATSAANSASSASTSASDASSSASSASSSASNASSSASSASSSASSASSARSGAVASAATAGVSATAAGASAAAASASASAAAGSAAAALSSANSAATRALTSTHSADNAYASAVQAENSAVSASGSATTATTSATEAASSASAAATSATSAASEATAAATSATNAATSATQANESRLSADIAAGTARDKAVSCEANATQALTSKEAAASSASTATIDASNASSSAAAAATSATEAATSAAEAASSATTAQSAAASATSSYNSLTSAGFLTLASLGTNTTPVSGSTGTFSEQVVVDDYVYMAKPIQVLSSSSDVVLLLTPNTDENHLAGTIVGLATISGSKFRSGTIKLEVLVNTNSQGGGHTQERFSFIKHAIINAASTYSPVTCDYNGKTWFAIRIVGDQAEDPEVAWFNGMLKHTGGTDTLSIVNVVDVTNVLDFNAQETIQHTEFSNQDLVLTNGNLGVGTINPTYKLDVHGTSNVGALTATSVGIGTASQLGKLHVYDGTATAGWQDFYVRPTSLWGDGLTTAAETGGITYMTMNNMMFQRPHITPSTAGGNAYIRYGRAGGVSTGVYWETACVPDGSFRIRRDANDAYGMTIDINGKVGIGTTSPDRPLHIYRSGANNAVIKAEAAGTQEAEIQLYHTGDAAAWGMYMPANSNSLRFYRNGDRMTLTSDGNVGIGTENPLDKLMVMNGTIRSHDSGNTTNIPGLKIRRRPAAEGQSGSNYIECGQFSDVGNDGSGTDGNRFIVKNDGNVGIGVTSPAYKLDVHGTSNVGALTTTSMTATEGIYVRGTGQTSTASFDTSQTLGASIIAQSSDSIPGSGGSLVLGTEQGNFAAIKAGILNGTSNTIGDLHFFTRNATDDATLTNRMTITNTGNVGIGVTSPAYKLDVHGTSNVGALTATSGTFDGEVIAPGIRTGNDTGYSFFGYSDGDPGISLNTWHIPPVGYEDESTYRAEILPTIGGIVRDLVCNLGRQGVFRWYNVNSYILRTNYLDMNSDDRIKTNEVFVENATNTLLKLKPQTYDKHIFVYDHLTEEEHSNVSGAGLVFSSYSNSFVQQSDFRETSEPERPWRKRSLSDKTQKETGLIAQDIWYDAPELRHIVSLSPDADPSEEKPVGGEDPQDDPDYDQAGWGSTEASVSYIQLIPLLIKSNQELHARILALENAI